MRAWGFYLSSGSPVRVLCASWIEDITRAQARDAHVPLLQIAQSDIHHCRHQCVVEGVVLSERWDVEISEDRREGEINRCIRRRIAVLSVVVKLRNLDSSIRQLDPKEA